MKQEDKNFIIKIAKDQTQGRKDIAVMKSNMEELSKNFMETIASVQNRIQKLEVGGRVNPIIDIRPPEGEATHAQILLDFDRPYSETEKAMKGAGFVMELKTLMEKYQINRIENLAVKLAK